MLYRVKEDLLGGLFEEEPDECRDQLLLDRAGEEASLGAEERIGREQMGLWEGVREEFEDDEGLAELGKVRGWGVPRLKLGPAIHEVWDLRQTR